MLMKPFLTRTSATALLTSSIEVVIDDLAISKEEHTNAHRLLFKVLGLVTLEQCLRLRNPDFEAIFTHRSTSINANGQVLLGNPHFITSVAWVIPLAEGGAFMWALALAMCGDEYVPE